MRGFLKAFLFEGGNIKDEETPHQALRASFSPRRSLRNELTLRVAKINIEIFKKEKEFEIKLKSGVGV